MNPDLTYWTEGDSCCNERWENAYNRFETMAQADRKFHRRLIRLGARGWSRNSRVVELFCGSGRNLSCLRKMGFVDLHGVDLSPRLLSLHQGNAKLSVGDATRLMFPDAWADIVIVQGGFHHLPALPGDFEKCLDEIHRILKPEGILVLVEPWLTPFLSCVHWCCRQSFLRKMSGKIDALATMIEEEQSTYFRWLGMPEILKEKLLARFRPAKWICEFGKLKGVFSKRGRGVRNEFLT